MALTIGSGTFTNGSTSVTGVTFTSGGASFISSGTLLGVGVSPMDRQVEAISATTNTITLREAWGGTTGAKQFTAAYTTEGLRDAVDAARGFSEQLATRSTATTTDMQTATNDVKIATPLKVKQSIDFHAYNKAAADAQFFSRSNIVGTVSQSGGVPTGTIIERGSNVNGEYTKYADGTMICNGEVDFSGVITGQTLTLTYTHPSTFSSIPEKQLTAGTSFSASLNKASLIYDSGAGSNASQTRLAIQNISDVTTDYKVTITLHGRWY